MDPSPVQIVSCDTEEPTAAMLHLQLSPHAVAAAEDQWGPMRARGTEWLRQLGVSAQRLPQHRHWNWRDKSAYKLQSSVYRCSGVSTVGGRTQGLMLFRSDGRLRARLGPDAGRPLLYVEYLEVAPWNSRLLTPFPRFGGVGTRLFEAAVRVSQSLGFDGRVGLHSLPQAAGFYTGPCRMLSTGVDPDVESLAYFELTKASATIFLSEG